MFCLLVVVATNIYDNDKDGLVGVGLAVVVCVTTYDTPVGLNHRICRHRRACIVAENESRSQTTAQYNMLTISRNFPRSQ